MLKRGAVVLTDDELDALVRAGRHGHDVALAHETDPGSNGHTFGADRYHRSTELASLELSERGFTCHRRGAGLVARRAALVLEFAVARGTNLHDPSAFDADSSPARRRAAVVNSAAAGGSMNQVLPGMPKLPADAVVHVIWSGTKETGYQATHVGQLIAPSRSRLEWAWLECLDAASTGSPVRADPHDQATLPLYSSQPQPELAFEARAVQHADEG